MGRGFLTPYRTDTIRVLYGRAGTYTSIGIGFPIRLELFGNIGHQKKDFINYCRMKFLIVSVVVAGEVVALSVLNLLPSNIAAQRHPTVIRHIQLLLDADCGVCVIPPTPTPVIVRDVDMLGILIALEARELLRCRQVLVLKLSY